MPSFALNARTSVIQSVLADDTLALNSIQTNEVGVSGKYFQMEEIEDAENRMTGILLHSNGTISSPISDIPSCIHINGHWEQIAGGQFSMTLRRTFSAGRKAISDTDMGEFEFTMNRYYKGELVSVGALLGVQGVAYEANEVFGPVELGYFSMINTEKNPSFGSNAEFVFSGMTQKASQL